MIPAKTTKTILYFILFLLTIPLGLATRRYTHYFPSIVSIYGGDVLYAACLFFLLRFLFPATELLKIGVICYLGCIVIELLQLYKAPWIVALRHTFPFGLILGFDFALSDCICYLAGCILALAVGWVLERRLPAH
ncbi:ribosomal maturation YjgA family protein [Chitinophaga rhizophila]|uniref:DUF2809 domain-containing protein n=1 Tax=Chitinophaga rhizophila TaxID=2866212 RepID=A0ABS7GJT6_9BACT|nr:DUF2809 domain-containing protein [Chitinophaga rhizophila]MBW8687014.1 DUF2809 domain-containing protein [Chitinophaga rhizophila]